MSGVLITALASLATDQGFATAVEAIRAWRADPVLFVRQVLKAEPDAWQVEVLQACTVNIRIALKASKGPGKSTLLAWIIWWFLVTRLNPKVVAVSISGDNLRDNLWTELSKWQANSPFLQAAFTWSGERIVCNDHPETWWASARSYPKQADSARQADTLAGVHADAVLFVLDEVGGIPDAVMAAAKAALANRSVEDGREAMLVIAGNPTQTSGPLYNACTKERTKWWVKEISGDPDDPKRAPRVSIDWAREQIEEYGRDSPYVLVNVFGQFPPSSLDTMLGLELVTAGTKRVLGETDYIDEALVMGVDVARFGDDRSVVTLRRGRAVFKQKVFRGLETMELAGQCSLIIEKWKPDGVFVDQTGIGAGVVDRLRQLGFTAVGVDNAEKPTDSKYLNKRAEMWGRLGAWLKVGGALPNDAELISELTAPVYWFNNANKIQLESKKELKARGMPSPDKADSLTLTFAYPVQRKRLLEPLAARSGGHRALTEYDPYAEVHHG